MRPLAHWLRKLSMSEWFSIVNGDVLDGAHVCLSAIDQIRVVGEEASDTASHASSET